MVVILKEKPVKRTLSIVIAAAVLAAIGTAVLAATPDGCMPGNGGSEPICTPGTGPGGK